MNKQGKLKPLALGIGVLVILGIIIALPIALNSLFGGKLGVAEQSVLAGTNENEVLASSQCSYTPTMTFNGLDAYSSTVLATSGSTAYYKTNGLGATASAPTITQNLPYEFWISNASTYYVLPVKFDGKCGDNAIQTWIFNNQSSSPTLTLIDNFDGQPISNTNNVSNTGTPSVTLKYAGVAFKSAMPFGGVMALDYNKTITSVVCNSNVVDLSPLSTFHMTSHSASSTTYATKFFQIGSTIDSATGKITRGLDDGTGNSKDITCQFLTNGNAVGAQSQVTFTFYPANYYLTDNKDIVLDTEQTLVASASNTRTGKGSAYTSFYWSG